MFTLILKKKSMLEIIIIVEIIIFMYIFSLSLFHYSLLVMIFIIVIRVCEGVMGLVLTISNVKRKKLKNLITNIDLSKL